MGTEYKFALSKVNNNDAITGLEADARQIVQVLLQQQTFINGLGVCLPARTFMQATSENLESIKATIQTVLNKAFPDVQFNAIELSEVGTNAYLLGISIGTATDEYVFGISLKQNFDTNKLLYDVIW